MIPFWQIHFLNARHALTPVMSDIRAAARDAVAAVAAHVDLPSFDVVVQAGRGIPEWGAGGYAPAPGIIHLTVDPARFSPTPVIRTLVHELHHVIRWDGPGYGRSLGGALVSEGLAGHFVRQVLDGAPDPWDVAPVPAALTRRAVTEWARRDYDHAEWFLGTGKIRRWAGYALGHRLVGAYLDAHPDDTAATLAHVAEDALRPTLLRLAGEDRAEALPGPADDADGPDNPDDGAQDRPAADAPPDAPPDAEPDPGTPDT